LVGDGRPKFCLYSAVSACQIEEPAPGIKTISNQTKRIAIIGAGLRGLASAAWLRSAGAEVRVFEKTSHVGGVWRRVHAGARINTPSFGYTFHASNRWQSPKPSQAEILENLERLVRISRLERAIQFETPVHGISKTESGKWTVNDESPEYDGVLVCPGFLSRRKAVPLKPIALSGARGGNHPRPPGQNRIDRIQAWCWPPADIAWTLPGLGSELPRLTQRLCWLPLNTTCRRPFIPTRRAAIANRKIRASVVTYCSAWRNITCPSQGAGVCW